jgi:small GTP-binding protein
MADYSDSNSFNTIKELISMLKPEEIKILTNILVFNKSDIDTKQITNNEINEFKSRYTSFQNIDLSIKNEQNFSNLLEKIYSAVEKENDLPINYISQCITNHKTVFSQIQTKNTIRIVLLGDTTVGKSAFLTRYFKNSFNDTFIMTIGIDDENQIIKVFNTHYKLTVWDTAGQERFRSLPKRYYQNADGILLLYDVTQESTFKNIRNWVKDIHENSNIGDKQSLFLIGNKIDLPDRVISKTQAEELAKELNIQFCEISCKINMNINEVMARIIKCVIESNLKENNITSIKDLKKINNENRNSNCCSKN